MVHNGVISCLVVFGYDNVWIVGWMVSVGTYWGGWLLYGFIGLCAIKINNPKYNLLQHYSDRIMHSSEEEDNQQPTTPFKTIEHEAPTRHPTTHKKQSLYYSPHQPHHTEHTHSRRTHSERCRSQSLRESMYPPSHTDRPTG